VGKAAMEELVELCDASRDVVLASSKALADLAFAVAAGDAPGHRWRSTIQGFQGNPVLAKARGGVFYDFFTDEKLDHMAGSDGDEVYDVLDMVPPEGVYICSDQTLVYTGGAIRDRVASAMSVSHSTVITAIRAVAGAGKTYSIIQGAGPDDVVLCETRKALEEAAQGLMTKKHWRGRHYTVDGFMIWGPTIERCDTLWVDEVYRLHAGKLHTVIKMLKPDKVRCFGDDKQVAVLPFVPGFDFVHHELVFDSVEVIRKTRRCPADVCFALSAPEYYGFNVETYNPILRSVEGPVQYMAGMFDTKPRSTVLLTYTQTAKHELQEAGVYNVMTIGESQGSNFDEVILFREKELKKALYYSYEQTLVGVTRHKRRLTVVSAAAAGSGDSLAEKLCAYLKDKADVLVLSSHLAPGVAAVAGPEEYYARQHRGQRALEPSVASSEWMEVS